MKVMVSGSRYPTFRAFLEEQRPAIVAAIAGDLTLSFREQLASLSEYDLTPYIDTNVGGYFDALDQGDHQPLVHSVQERIVLHTSEGATLTDVLQILGTYRHHFLRASLLAVTRQIDDAQAGTLALMELCDVATTTIATVYHHLMEQANSELQTFKELVDNAQDGISLISIEGKRELTYVNRAYENLTGLRVGNSVADHYAPDYHATFIVNHVIPLMKRKGYWRGIQHLRHPNGQEWTAQVSSFLLNDPNGAATVVGTILRDVTSQQMQEQTLHTFQTLVEHAPDGIVLTTIEGKITYANPAFYTISGYEDEALGMRISDLHAPDVHESPETPFEQFMAEGLWQGSMLCQRKDGHRFPAHITAFLIYDNDGQSQGQAVIVRDISTQQQAEQERMDLQAEIIKAQQDALRELSTPLLPLSDTLIALPLVGTVDSARAQQVMETLLEGIATYQADMAIIDITGVRVVDTQVAQALIRTAQAVKLLGARVILTGIQPQIAQTLVHLGVDLGDMVTQRTLQAGIAYALTTK